MKTKKTMLCLTFLAFLLSCTNSDEANGCLNPPDWLKGSWVLYYSNSTETYISNKVVITDNDVTYHDYNHDGTLAQTPLSARNTYCNNLLVEVSDEATESYYMWKYVFGSEIMRNYFHKQSDTTIIIDNFLLDEFTTYSVYVKQ